MFVKHFQCTSWTLGCALNIFSAFVRKHVCVLSSNVHLLKLCEEHVIKNSYGQFLLFLHFLFSFLPLVTQESSNSSFYDHASVCARRGPCALHCALK